MSSSPQKQVGVTPFADGEAEGPPAPGSDKGPGGKDVSYLEADKLGPSGSRAIFSFWVQLDMPSGDDNKDDPWPEELYPPELIGTAQEPGIIGASEFAVSGGSYWPMPPKNFFPPRLPLFPQRGISTFVKKGYTWKHKFVPFICWGDPPEYKPCFWQKKTIEPSYYYYGPGGGWGAIVSQQPKSKTQIDNEEKERQEARKEMSDADKAKSDAKHAEENKGITNRAGAIYPVTTPSMIGCREDGKLRIVLQTPDMASYKGYAWSQYKAKSVRVLTPVGEPYFGGSVLEIWMLPNVYAWIDFAATGDLNTHIPNPTFRGEAIYYEDVSKLECNQMPEAFVLDPDVKIADGKWHHILFSYSFTGETDKPEGEDKPIVFSEGGGGGGGGTPPAPSGPPPAIARIAPTPRADGEVEGPPQPDGTPPIQPAADPNADFGKGLIKAKATGPPGIPPHPGTYGQFSGYNGDNEPVPGFGPQGQSAAPGENVGEFGWADGGEMESTAKAWLMVDGKEIKNPGLNHSWKNALGMYVPLWKPDCGLKDNDIAPPNAFLCMGTPGPKGGGVAGIGEIRSDMITSLTLWERWYRTQLGAWLGPAAKIEPTDEKRRLDYERPSYEFKPERTCAGPIGIPAGSLIEDRNFKIKMAELHIWDNKAFDVKEYYDLFKDPGRIFKMDEKWGKPTIRLHWASNWKHGKNTGTSGPRKTGPASGVDAKEADPDRGAFNDVGKIVRYLPDPKKQETEK